MVYSTGRGGAGNIRTSTTETSERNEGGDNIQQVRSDPTSVTSEEKKRYYLTGRGGAGNIKSGSEIPSPKLVPQGSNTPQLHSEKITTGRGGFGNIIKNDNAELSRKLQDVDGGRNPQDRERDAELYAVTSNKSFSVGRGGFGNVMSHTKSRTSQNSGGPVNLMAVLSHGAREKNDETNKKKGFLGKLKGLFN